MQSTTRPNDKIVVASTVLLCNALYMKSKQKQAELATVVKLRSHYGFVQIKKGKRACLKCDKAFSSPDLHNQKTCNRCRDRANSL